MTRRVFLSSCVAVFAAIWLALLPSRASLPHDLAFSGDARDYNAGAAHLLAEGMYSLDGVTPTMEREPGQSAFLALIYAVFGLENAVAIYAVQGVLFLLASLLFVRELERGTSPKVAAGTLLFLVVAPSIYHVIYSPYRESLTLSLFLLFSAAALAFMRSPDFLKALLLGTLLGIIALTYYPFVFFPLFFVAFLFALKVRKVHLALILCVPFLLVSLWAFHNLGEFNTFRVAGTFREAAMWHVRGEQAEELRGFDAFRCLLAEYITRDWSVLKDSCSTNHIINVMWPNRIPRGDEALLAREGQRKILRNLPHHLVFTAFEVLELHLPFVNGWGFLYNVLASAFTVVLLLFGLLGLRRAFREWRTFGLFLLLPAYAILIFTLTDATPRYLTPVIFCYAVLAAVGYDAVLRRAARL